MNKLTKEDYEKTMQIKHDLDNRVIEVKDVPKEYIKYLCILYDKQIERDKVEIDKIKKEKEEIRNKMKEAIEYLKNMKEEKQNKVICPKCGSSKVRAYIYGLIRGEIPDDCISGGCFVGPDNPIYYCDNCDSDIYVNDLKK